MNNDNPIVLLNENGARKEYSRVPDLWHIGNRLINDGLETQGNQVLEVWHMAHDLKACIENQGQARIISAADHKGLPWPGPSPHATPELYQGDVSPEFPPRDPAQGEAPAINPRTGKAWGIDHG